MAERTGITWTDSTVNFWWGCTEVTSACDNCYAKEWAARIRGMKWGMGAERIFIKSAPSLLKKIDRAAHKDGRIAKVFMHSMSDIFDKDVPNEWREKLFQAWRDTTNVYIQALTKRPAMPKLWAGKYPHEKVWLGTSLGSNSDLSMARKIIEAPALLHWVSYEPAIAPLDCSLLPHAIKWLVVGGESGKNARPFNMEWAFDIINQNRVLQYPMKIFIKQLGAKPFYRGKPFPTSDSHGKILSEWPDELRMQEFPL